MVMSVRIAITAIKTITTARKKRMVARLPDRYKSEAELLSGRVHFLAKNEVILDDFTALIIEVQNYHD
jgi:hypothetical protein